MNSSMLSSRRVVKLGSVEQCKLVVVVDNNMDSELETAWGLSIFIETPSSNFLFDTGPDKGVLERNMRKLKININDIDFVVISHDHGDHTGGLGYLAKNRPDITVYVPIGTSWIARSYGIKVVEVDKTIKLSEGVAIIGWLNGPPSEQSLAINVKGLGLFVFGGCSHPGIVSIVEKATRDLEERPYMVIGGFHMAWASRNKCKDVIEKLISLGVKKISPIHCSGDTIRNLLKQEYPDYYLEGHVGSNVVCRTD